MKKAWLCFMIAASLLSCNDNSKTTETATTDDNKNKADTATTAGPAMNLPYTAQYSSQFTTGDPKITEKILILFKQWDDNKLAEGKSLFADTVHFYANNWEFHGTRDSFFTVSQKQRDNYKEIKTVVHAWIPMHSTDKNEDWALIWSTAYLTDNKGKQDSTNFQDTWRLNKNGQFDLMYDYEAKSAKPPSKK
jgi:hypothetical protein